MFIDQHNMYLKWALTRVSREDLQMQYEQKSCNLRNLHVEQIHQDSSLM